MSFNTIFSQIDTSKTGVISAGDLQKALDNIGVSPNSTLSQGLLRLLDPKGTGEVSADEILKFEAAVESVSRTERREAPRFDERAEKRVIKSIGCVPDVVVSIPRLLCPR